MENGTSTQENVQMEFCTLGMFIIDRTIRTDIIGGAGTYSAIGARLLSPAQKSRTIGWIVDTGTDFPSSLSAAIASWRTGALIRTRPAGELTTRGWNGYSGNEHRAFKYLTPKKRLTADDLTPALLGSKSFHLICGPQRCVEQVDRILARRAEMFGAESPRPIFVWEPVPDLCLPTEREAHLEALRVIDVVSPNHDELGSLFGIERGESVDAAAVERQALVLLERGIAPNKTGAVIVRCGAMGCYVLSKETRCWLPAYHTDASRVVDPTGGGNGFLGGLSVGLVRNDFDVVEAARWGSVAASYCIEQVGMPELRTGGAQETWNETSVWERLDEFRRRCTT